jgi:DGQHR domain-containing protein
MGTISLTVSGIPVIQNQQDFIVGVFKIGQLLRYTKYTKRLIVNYDENGMPEYNPEIQREVENSRVEKIADFLTENPEAIFPTNIVLHIPSQVIISQEKEQDGRSVIIYLSESVASGVIKEQKEPGSGDIFITIIDGQHRIRGIELAIERLNAKIFALEKTIAGSIVSEDLYSKLVSNRQRLNDLNNIDLVVSFFVDKTLEYQAMIFSTINRTQKRVSESLVYSLFGLTTDDSPQKTSLQIVLALNAHPKSPFHNRVKLYGGEYARNQSPPLSQATMVRSIIELICENIRESERDRFRSRKELQRQNISKYLPFRLYYARDEDTKISDIFFYFFTSVKNCFKKNEVSFWDFDPVRMTPANVLQTTVGYLALLKLLTDILPKLNEGDRYKPESYADFLLKAKQLDFENQERYPFTSKTKNILYYDMSLAIWPPTDKNDLRIVQLQLELDK